MAEQNSSPVLFLNIFLQNAFSFPDWKYLTSKAAIAEMHDVDWWIVGGKVILLIGRMQNADPRGTLITCTQGNLKGESVAAAILPSCMEVSYCTSRFFIDKPAK